MSDGVPFCLLKLYNVLIFSYLHIDDFVLNLFYEALLILIGHDLLEIDDFDCKWDVAVFIEAKIDFSECAEA
jgi:hypothetical protein